jgi:hypothetical protein
MIALSHGVECNFCPDIEMYLNAVALRSMI